MTYFLAKLLLNLSTKFVTNFITIYITKFGDSQKSSLNLVKDFSQYFPLSMVSKKTHQDCHDICHQIWWFTKTVTKFGEKNHTLLITKHPSVPSSIIVLESFPSLGPCLVSFHWLPFWQPFFHHLNHRVPPLDLGSDSEDPSESSLITLDHWTKWTCAHIQPLYKAGASCWTLLSKSKGI